ncbi:MAG: cupin domain-containing protein [Planctomycetes bacterium]|nr:cupin domain-containing protein [Planctomycetota bacterium]
MYRQVYQNEISHLIIRKSKAKDDFKLKTKNLNGRKVMVNCIRPDKSRHIEKPEWEPPKNEHEKSNILETGCGGIEIATCNQKTVQKRHFHKIATEIYSVLEGHLIIEVNGKIVELDCGDEIIILPETMHKVIPETDFMARVHTVNCHGTSDKYD